MEQMMCMNNGVLRTITKRNTNCAYKGKVLPFTYKYRKNDILFYIGDIYVGQIFKMGYMNYTTFSSKTKVRVDGLRDLYYASEFLLYQEGYWQR